MIHLYEFENKITQITFWNVFLSVRLKVMILALQANRVVYPRPSWNDFVNG